MNSDFDISFFIHKCLRSIEKKRKKFRYLWKDQEKSFVKRVFSQMQNDNEVIFLSKIDSAVQVGDGVVGELMNKHFL